MKRPELTPKTLIGGAVSLILLMVLLIWLLGGALQENFIDPLADSLWWWWSFARMALPQITLWYGLLVLGLLNFILLTFRLVRLPNKPSTQAEKTGRVAAWIDAMHTGQKARRLFIMPLRNLTIKVFAVSQQRPYTEVQSQIHGREGLMPTHLHAYLQSGQTSTKPKPFSPSEPECEEILNILESQMSLAKE